MSHIFVSYSRKDTEIVDKLVNRCMAAGYKIWLDREDIAGGEQWQERIVKAIKAAGVFLVILSNNSVNSGNVRKEITVADIANIPILPLAIDYVDIPDNLEYQLAGLQILRIDPASQQQVNSILASLKNYSFSLETIEPETASEATTIDETTIGKFSATRMVFVQIVELCTRFLNGKLPPNVQIADKSFLLAAFKYFKGRRFENLHQITLMLAT